MNARFCVAWDDKNINKTYEELLGKRTGKKKKALLLYYFVVFLAGKYCTLGTEDE